MDQSSVALWLALAGAGFAVPWLVFFGGLWVARGFGAFPAQSSDHPPTRERPEMNTSGSFVEAQEKLAAGVPAETPTSAALKTNWIWPQIHDEASAEIAVKEAVGYASVVALVTAGIATASIFLGRPVVGYDAWNYLDAVLVGLIAFGLWKHSRVAAVAGLLYWLITTYIKSQNGRVGLVTILVFLGFIHGVRGTFAYRKYRSATPSS